MKLTLQSWYLARALGVTKTPPLPGIDYFEVKLRDNPGVSVWWPIVPEPAKIPTKTVRST